MTMPYYWRLWAKYGNYEVHQHVLHDGRFRVQNAVSGQEFRSVSEHHAVNLARTRDIAERSGANG